MITALITASGFDEGLTARVAEHARTRGVEVIGRPCETYEALAAAIAEHPAAEVMLADFLPDVPHAPGREGYGFEAFGGGAHEPDEADGPDPAGALRWIQLTAAGVNQEAASSTWKRRPEIAVTTASGLPSVAMTQWIAAAILHHAHHFNRLGDYRRTRGWALRREFQATVLVGRTLGILGFGGIGRRLAHVGHALGMRVVAVRRQPDRDRDALYRLPAIAAIDGDSDPAEVWGPDRLNDLLAASDVVVCTLPLTAETRGMLGAPEIGRMKETALFVNVSRGGVVDEPALIEALRTNRIAAAALDVFSREPLPADSPLFELPNVLLTPHVSGTHDHVAEFTAQLFLDNLDRYVDGLPLYNLVDRSAGY